MTAFVWNFLATCLGAFFGVIVGVAVLASWDRYQQRRRERL